MLKILKASAGSGKTFNLAKEYISLLLCGQERGARPDPYAYRHILAVTFTNKATDEMKRRILKELDRLASVPEESKYLADIQALTGNGIKTISDLARIALSNILNDYSAFSVSTIDRFFQRTLKSFAREVGQFASYQVSLDRDSLVRESVDRILDSLTDDRGGILTWLTESVEEQLRTSGKFSIEQDLYDMAASLKSEEHREMAERYGVDEVDAYSVESLNALRRECCKIIDNYRNKVKEAASGLLLKISRDCQVDPGDFKSNFMEKMLKPYATLKDGDEVAVPTSARMDSALNPEKWFAKGKASLLSRVDGVINADLKAFVKLFGRDHKVYSTAKLLARQVYSLRISNELNKSFDALMKEKHVLGIDDTNTILKGIIDGCDAPFIYEKTGIRYDHFLLDEFQDTSCIQWENFRPLLEDSIASGNSNLVVGDVKQSIYRWRNSDWNLLNTRLRQELDGVAEETLDSNWRSCRSVVEFNNSFYTFAASALDEMAGTEGGISGIYKDVCQKVMSSDPQEGNVDVIFCKGDKENELVAVLNEVRRLVSSGARYSDIGVTVRKNDDGAMIAKMLMNEGIPVISDDSLKIKSSPAVRRLTALLSCCCNPEDSLNSYIASSLDVSSPESCLSISDLCEHFIRELDPDGEVPYLQSFMDIVQEWSQVYGNSLQEFLAYWDTVEPKICSPDGKDAVRIITIHKSKGLEFPYVIFPFAEKVSLKPSSPSSDFHWWHPEVAGTELEKSAGGVYRVRFSSKVTDTLFADSYEREKKMRAVDALNVFYVATTRARCGMTIISAMPSEKAVPVLKGDAAMPFQDVSSVLYRHVSHLSSAGRMSFAENELGEVYHVGEPYTFGHSADSRDCAGQSGIDMDKYLSFPRNLQSGGDKDAASEPRLKFSTEASDFFSDEGLTGIRASGRLRGIVLHDILSRVAVPEDMDRALRESFESGSIDKVEMDDIRELLSSRIGAARKRGWFPDRKETIYREVPIIDGDGEIYRPDRVIVDGSSVCVIDFKFGVPRGRYRDQVRKYAGLYMDMGYTEVSAFLWYVPEDKVDKVL